jgi:hypothetical protein
VLKKSFVHGTYPDPKVIGTESNREHRSIFQQPARAFSGEVDPVRRRKGVENKDES